MMLASLDRTEDGTGVAFAMPPGWSVTADEVPAQGSPYEIEDADLESTLLGLPEAARVSPEDLAALVEAEAPSLWFL